MTSSTANRRQLEVGASVVASGVNFSVWAPDCNAVHVVLTDNSGSEGRTVSLSRDDDGFFSVQVSDIGHGQPYFFRLDNRPQRFPDPASRFQPQGVHGLSQVIDPSRYTWGDDSWSGVGSLGQVIYELHVGTFTPEGTWSAAASKLPHLKNLGITLIEVMPVAEFPGAFGWGYDGVYWFAPDHAYGEPDDFRRFVDQAHQLGIGVLLDVVYNHFGPAGNYLPTFSPYYLSKARATEWGDSINYDGERCEPVREFVTSNAAYWIRDFHLDGLRLDATHSIWDTSHEHILAALGRAGREAAGERSILIVAENETQDVRHVLSPEVGGYGLDCLWNDDFHHAARVAATGNGEAYYGDYSGSPQELISVVRLGYLYQGQWNARQGKNRGSPTRSIPATHFIHFLQNHDQVSNSVHGLRTHLLTTPGRHRALTALLLLGPATPMLFMGQEFGASSPFLFFADHEPELARLVREGRQQFLLQFPETAAYQSVAGLPDPADANTFVRSKLNWAELEQNNQALQLHTDLIRLRRNDAVFSRQDKSAIEGAVVGTEAFVLRWFDDLDDDRLALFNLGRDLSLQPLAEPLVAAPPAHRWQLLWSSEEPRYGGSGTVAIDQKKWRIPRHAAIVFRAVANR